MAKKIRDLNLNDKVRFGRHVIHEEAPEPIIWRVVAKNHQCEPAYPEDSITLHTDRIIDLRCVDAAEPDHPSIGRQKFGNNRYIKSNIHLWLNSTASPGCWYSPQHEYDSAPDSIDKLGGEDNTVYSHLPGFLYNFTAEERAGILDTQLRVATDKDTDVVSYDDFTAKIFYASRTEMGCGIESYVDEGAPWPVYDSDESRKCVSTQQLVDNVQTPYKGTTTSPSGYMLRTAVASNEAWVHYIPSSGMCKEVSARAGNNGMRPAMNISGNTWVSDEPDEDGYYDVIFNDPPEIEAMDEGDLGKLALPLTISYTVKDPDKSSLKITERLNGEEIRSLAGIPSGTALILDLSGKWPQLSKDTPHSVSIEVDDGVETAAREWSFNVIESIDYNLTGQPVEMCPTAVKVPKLPIKVHVTNNALDQDIVWEDASDALLKGKNYDFVNDEKTADNWCVAVKYIIDGTASGTVDLKTIHKVL